MTNAELLRLLYLQDSRWSKLIDHAMATGQNAKPAKRWFLEQWTPDFAHAMTQLSNNGSAQSAGNWNEILRYLNVTTYPAARRVGLPDSSFVLPDISICSPTVGGVMSVAKSFYDIVSSDEALALATAVNPGLGMTLGTAIKASELVSRAKDGDTEALAKLKVVRRAADSGSAAAIASIKELVAISKAQDAKAAKKSFWGGLVSIGADYRAGVNPLPKLPKGLAVRPGKPMDFGFNLHEFYPELNSKTDGSFPTAAGQKAWKDYQAFWKAYPTGSKPPVTQGPPAPRQQGNGPRSSSNLGTAPAGYVWMNDHWERGTPTSLEATSPTSGVNQYGWPVGTTPPIDPNTGLPIPYATFMAQQQQVQQYNPYGYPQPQYPYGGYPQPQYPGYPPQYGYQDPYAAYGYGQAQPVMNPYQDPNNPYADWLEQPTASANKIYDPATGMFFSNQVNEQYDSATDSFVPVVCYNPYNPGY